MALADIIARIDADAAAEVAAIEAAAAKRAASIRADAQTRAEQYAAGVVAAAEHNALRETATIVANANLASRDAAVSAKRALLDEALVRIRAALADLPREDYVRFVAACVVAQAKGGEKLSLGSADSEVAADIRDRVAAEAPHLELKPSGHVAPFERGALLEGDRVRAEISLEAVVQDQRDALALDVSRVLFGEGE